MHYFSTCLARHARCQAARQIASRRAGGAPGASARQSPSPRCAAACASKTIRTIRQNTGGRCHFCPGRKSVSTWLRVPCLGPSSARKWTCATFQRFRGGGGAAGDGERARTRARARARKGERERERERHSEKDREREGGRERQRGSDLPGRCVTPWTTVAGVVFAKRDSSKNALRAASLPGAAQHFMSGDQYAFVCSPTRR